MLFIDDTYCVYSAFSPLHVRKHMLAASVATGDVESKQHKTRKIHTQNTQIWLNYWLDYVFGVDLRRMNGFINVVSAFWRSFQRQFYSFVSFT